MQLKAAFLLIVFSMNMVIGLGCAVGIHKWFYTSHHVHVELTATEGSHQHHDEGDRHHESKGGKDNCCNDHVIKFSQVDKSIRHVFAGLSALFFTPLISSFYFINVIYTFRAAEHIKYIVQDHHPPIPDIRIAIQSFQI